MCLTIFSDVDECAMNIHSCSPLATCHNVPDSYYCTCLTGYTGDGFTCTGNHCYSVQRAAADAELWKRNVSVKIKKFKIQYGHDMLLVQAAQLLLRKLVIQLGFSATSCPILKILEAAESWHSPNRTVCKMPTAPFIIQPHYRVKQWPWKSQFSQDDFCLDNKHENTHNDNKMDQSQYGFFFPNCWDILDGTSCWLCRLVTCSINFTLILHFTLLYIQPCCFYLLCSFVTYY